MGVKKRSLTNLLGGRQGLGDINRDEVSGDFVGIRKVEQLILKTGLLYLLLKGNGRC